VLRQKGSAGPDILLFKHPLAGVQLVKGTREVGEDIILGACRELREESGLIAATDDAKFLSSSLMPDGLIWHFVQVSVDNLADHWTFQAADDGGHEFAFFWWPLQAQPEKDWHQVYIAALQHLRGSIN
jgi:8-oxo-dGTP pyrophosphatase MutT (NUDIX family)